MSQEKRVMWFGSFLGGLIMLFFSAIGISQFCKNVDMPKLIKAEKSQDKQ